VAKFFFQGFRNTKEEYMEGNGCDVLRHCTNISKPTEENHKQALEPVAPKYETGMLTSNSIVPCQFIAMAKEMFSVSN
jgi:hypothetical protein